MKTITFNTVKELKSAVTDNIGTNPNFKFHKSEIKSINGTEIKTYLEITNKYVSHYIGCGINKYFDAPFIVTLKNN